MERLARAHLPGDIAAQWVQLLRPAARLRPAAPATDLIVGQLGGLPSLPSDVRWPEWPDHGPLSFVAAIDCDAIDDMGLDIALPPDGQLLFFYFDGQLDDGRSLVIYSDPASVQGARVLFVPSEKHAAPRACPDGLKPYPRIDLIAALTATYPTFEDLFLMDTFRTAGQTRREFVDHPVNNTSFVEALFELELGPRHQIGGYASPVQGAVEYEVAQAALGGKVPWESPALSTEARRWRLLLQIDTDDRANMTWGDAGMLYWMIRPSDLLERRFEAASFTWQCM
jgi:uncharacterized protein YwqG